jgi:hypothetical protein
LVLLTARTLDGLRRTATELELTLVKLCGGEQPARHGKRAGHVIYVVEKRAIHVAEKSATDEQEMLAWLESVLHTQGEIEARSE